MKVLLDGYGEVPVATSFWERWRGLRGSPPGSALLLVARSVHGFGMDRPVWAIFLDRSMTVIGSEVLKPRHIVSIAGARWVLEIPIETAPPPVGTRLAPHG